MKRSIIITLSIFSVLIENAYLTPIPTTTTNWKIDGSTGFKSEGNIIRFVGNEPGSKAYNALYEDGEGITNGEHYWQFKILESDKLIALGITEKSKFKQGWATSGLLYNGRLTNVGAILNSEQFGLFGPPLKPNDIFGIFVTFVDDRLKIYFDLNGKSLGLAFDQPKSIFTNGIYPLVHFSGKGAVSIEKLSNKKPISFEREEIKYNGLEGNWKLINEEFKVKGSAFEIPNKLQVTLKLSEKNLVRNNEETYRGTIRIENAIDFNLVKKTISEAGTGEQLWSTSSVYFNEFGVPIVPPPILKIEQHFFTLAEKLTKIDIKMETGKEILGLKNLKDEIETKWERFTPLVTPFTDTPFFF